VLHFLAGDALDRVAEGQCNDDENEGEEGHRSALRNAAISTSA
jgi:hypothetical protein